MDSDCITGGLSLGLMLLVVLWWISIVITGRLSLASDEYLSSLFSFCLCTLTV